MVSKYDYDRTVLHILKSESDLQGKLDWKNVVGGLWTASIKKRSASKVTKDDGTEWKETTDINSNTFEIETKPGVVTTTRVRNYEGAPLKIEKIYANGNLYKYDIKPNGTMISSFKNVEKNTISTRMRSTFTGIVTTMMKSTDGTLLMLEHKYNNRNISYKKRQANGTFIETFTNAVEGTVTNTLTNARGDILNRKMKLSNGYTLEKTMQSNQTYLTLKTSSNEIIFEQKTDTHGEILERVDKRFSNKNVLAITRQHDGAFLATIKDHTGETIETTKANSEKEILDKFYNKGATTPSLENVGIESVKESKKRKKKPSALKKKVKEFIKNALNLLWGGFKSTAQLLLETGEELIKRRKPKKAFQNNKKVRFGARFQVLFKSTVGLVSQSFAATFGITASKKEFSERNMSAVTFLDSQQNAMTRQQNIQETTASELTGMDLDVSKSMYQIERQYQLSTNTGKKRNSSRKSSSRRKMSR